MSAIFIDSEAIYDDDALIVALGVGPQVLKRARQARELRYTRKGQRTLYLGSWVLTWLQNAPAAEEQGVVDAK